MAVSGGIDSVALLQLLLELRTELGIVLSVVHFNHKLRGEESEADEQFVAGLARAHGLELLRDSEDVAEHAAQEGISLEAAARELRYGFFRYLLGSEGTSGAKAPDQGEAADRSAESVAPPNLDKIVTGHTLDDQAETVLMRIIRGTGVTGLRGIHPRIAVDDDHGEFCGEIVRPLLATRRHELERYLKDIGQSWREDSTNSDHAFMRNRLRKVVLPLLKKEFNSAIAENLSDLSEIARGEEDYWQNEVAGWMGTAVHWVEPEWIPFATGKADFVQIATATSQPSQSRDDSLRARIENARWLVMNASVSRPWLLSEPVAVQRRVVKAIGEHAGIPLEFRHVEEILRFADEGRGAGELTLPHGWKLVRHPEELLFVTPDLREAKPPQDYQHELAIPGRAVLAATRTVIESHRVPAEAVAEYNPDQLLNADSLSGSLRVRNWRAGDRFWPAHTKSPKKIKDLLQDRHVVQPERALWPVIVCGDEIVWVRGFATHAKHRPMSGRDAVLIAEERLG